MLASGVTATAGFAVLDRQRHPVAARLRARHRPRPRGRPGRRARGPAGHADLGGGRLRAASARLARAAARPSSRLRGHAHDGRPSARGEPERERLRSTSRYSVWVGVAFVIVIAVASINTFTNDEGGLLGADAQAGEPLPEFAVPELPGGEDGGREHLPGRLRELGEPLPGRRAAHAGMRGRASRACSASATSSTARWCSRSGSRAPRSARRPRISSTTRRAATRAGSTSSRSTSGASARTLERIVRERGWSFPVGWDRDGAVSNLYRVGVCPTVALILPGGILREAKIGTEELDRGKLATAIEELLREAREQAEADEMSSEQRTPRPAGSTPGCARSSRASGCTSPSSSAARGARGASSRSACGCSRTASPARRP